MSKLKIVISGSFRKHITGIQQKIREFRALGFEVLSPALSEPRNPQDDFVLLKSDAEAEPKIVEGKHLDAIKKASALYIFNPDGYLGASATMEFGFALALDKPIYTFADVNDVTLNAFSRTAPPVEVKHALQQ